MHIDLGKKILGKNNDDEKSASMCVKTDQDTSLPSHQSDAHFLFTVYFYLSTSFSYLLQSLAIHLELCMFIAVYMDEPGHSLAKI